MSQRLLISFKKNINKKEDDFYDAIFDESSDIRSLLEWISYDQGSYLGPLKITIRDVQLFSLFNVEFEKLCKILSELKGYEDIWGIYYNDKILTYPNINEVLTLLNLKVTLTSPTNTDQCTSSEKDQ